jgi:hypothetical protein
MVTMARIRITGGIKGKDGLDIDNITAGLKEQVTRYTNEIQSGTNGPVLEGMKTQIQGVIDLVKSTNAGGAALEAIKSLETKLQTASGANNPNNTTAPTTPLQPKEINLNMRVSATQAITDVASQAFLQNKDVWSDILKRQEKDYLSL